MQRADGTHEFPDRGVSPVWQSESGELVFSASSFWREGKTFTYAVPKRGRWLPCTLPVFPTRKKCDARLCWITVLGERLLASWTACDYPFRALRKDGCVYHHNSEVSDIQWLTPEYEDELTSHGQTKENHNAAQ